jgi:catechol 2,3-dioxygenase-like lactoylglutathione lyase family enzyme
MQSMARGIDHVVHAVRDLDAAAETYRRLGFLVGTRNSHPWGTDNYVIQFAGSFIELLTLAHPDKLGSDGFSDLFGRYTGDFLKRQEGLSLLLLESRDARADQAAFREADIAASDPLHFEREGTLPDGKVVKVGFSLAFAKDALAPDIHFATCQQHYPENFWNPRFQTHANSTTGIAGVVAVAKEPARHLDFMQAFTGAKASRVDADGFAIATSRGTVEMVTPAEFLRRYGVRAPEVERGARLAALRFTVADVRLVQGAPEQAGIGGLPGKAVVIGPAQVLGAVLVFEASR